MKRTKAIKLNLELHVEKWAQIAYVWCNVLWMCCYVRAFAIQPSDRPTESAGMIMEKRKKEIALNE